MALVFCIVFYIKKTVGTGCVFMLYTLCIWKIIWRSMQNKAGNVSIEGNDCVFYDDCRLIYRMMTVILTNKATHRSDTASDTRR